MRVVIAGGGTAGHVNPGIALAAALGEQVSFIGTRTGLEARLVPASGYGFEAISLEGFDRSRPARFPLVAARAAGAVAASRRLLGRERPSVVVGMGGYVSLPVCLAARSRGIPVVLHEQNIVLGLAHRVSKPVARRIAVSFAETLRAVGAKAVLTGNPVLPHIATLDRSARRD
ncbi:MAG: glycosyltransferase, partial [Actinomycetota bacterium]|nr:glycosyltransferase [Actinomycetota bacterium]